MKSNELINQIIDSVINQIENGSFIKREDTIKGIRNILEDLISGLRKKLEEEIKEEKARLREKENIIHSKTEELANQNNALTQRENEVRKRIKAVEEKELNLIEFEKHKKENEQILEDLKNTKKTLVGCEREIKLLKDERETVSKQLININSEKTEEEKNRNYYKELVGDLRKQKGILEADIENFKEIYNQRNSLQSEVDKLIAKKERFAVEIENAKTEIERLKENIRSQNEQIEKSLKEVSLKEARSRESEMKLREWEDRLRDKGDKLTLAESKVEKTKKIHKLVLYPLGVLAIILIIIFISDIFIGSDIEKKLNVSGIGSSYNENYQPVTPTIIAGDYFGYYTINGIKANTTANLKVLNSSQIVMFIDNYPSTENGVIVELKESNEINITGLGMGICQEINSRLTIRSKSTNGNGFLFVKIKR